MTTTQPTGTKRPWWKTKWAAIAAVVIILAAIFGNMGEDEDAATIDAAPTEQATKAATEQAEAEGEGEPSVADVEAALTMGTDYAPDWVAPIAEMDVRGDTLEVKYQETTDFDEEWAELGQKFHNFLRAADPPIQMGTIVFTDAEGIDHNVFCGKTKCADSVMDTDI